MHMHFFCMNSVAQVSGNTGILKRKSLPEGGRWWRGLDSNQCSLRRQIYSLMDLTTLPPLHIFGQEPKRVCVSLAGLWLAIAKLSTPLNALPKRKRTTVEKSTFFHRLAKFIVITTLASSGPSKLSHP